MRPVARRAIGRITPMGDEQRGSAGYTLTEILLVLGITATLGGMAIPLWSDVIDHVRAAAAARYVAARVAALRMDAIRRSSAVGLRFQAEATDYVFTPFLDGNGNGLRSLEVTSGIDIALGVGERLRDQFPGTGFGLLGGIPDLDGSSSSANGVRIGSSSFLTLTPAGSATSGTLYVHGRRAQYAIRILGVTARARFYYYDSGVRRWIAR